MTWFNHSIEAFSFALLSIIFEGLPFLLLGSVISGLIDVFVSSERIVKLLPKRPLPAALLAGLLGLVFPICECGSVVVVRRFLKKGLPLGSAVAYMLAAPIVSPIVALSTFKAFTGQDPWLMLGLRMGIGYALAVGIALVLQRLPQKAILQPDLVEPAKDKRSGLRKSISSDEGNVDFNEMVAKSSRGRKFLLAVQSATSDFLDVTVFFIIGASLASLCIGFKEASLLPLVEMPFISIISLMGMAALLCLCSTTDAFIAANAFVQFPFAAKLGFLLFGPMFDLKLIWLYGLIFKKRVVFWLGVTLFTLIAFICWRVSFIESWQPKLPGSSPAAESTKSALSPPNLELPKK